MKIGISKRFSRIAPPLSGFIAAIVVFVLIILGVGTVFIYAAQLRDRDAQIESLRSELTETSEELAKAQSEHEACRMAADGYRMSAVAFSEAVRSYLAQPLGKLDLSKATKYAEMANTAGCE